MQALAEVLGEKSYQQDSASLERSLLSLEEWNSLASQTGPRGVAPFPTLSSQNSRPFVSGSFIIFVTGFKGGDPSSLGIIIPGSCKTNMKKLTFEPRGS
jgi:hypothetical protein